MKRILGVLVFGMVVTLAACGGGGGGGYTPDTSCADSSKGNPSFSIDTEGGEPWTLCLEETDSSCSYPPSLVECTLDMDMVVTDPNVTISGTCTSTAAIPVTITIGGIGAKMYGDTLYWGAQFSGSASGYSETDTVPCIGAQFFNTEEGQYSDYFYLQGTSHRVSVSYSGESGSGECWTEFVGVFGGPDSC